MEYSDDNFLDQEEENSKCKIKNKSYITNRDLSYPAIVGNPAGWTSRISYPTYNPLSC